MNIIITGASSFIGLNLLKKLLTNNCNLYLIVNKNSKNNINIPKAKNIYTFYDINDLQKDIKYFACFHFAWAGVGSSGRENEDVQKSNVELSKNIFNWCNLNKVKKFIFAGSQAEIGLKSAYGKAKKEVANYCLENAKNIKVIHLRIFSVYGEIDHENSLINYCIDSLLKNTTAKLSKCEHIWNYIYIDDLIKILIKIMLDINKNAEYDVASHTSMPLKEYVRLIGVKAEFGIVENNTEGAKDLISNINSLIEDIGDFDEIAFEVGIHRIIEFKQNRKLCLLCGGEIRSIFSMGNAPKMAQKLLKENSSNEIINLNLCMCEKCGLIQLNNKTVPYYKEVIRSGGISSTMKNLRIEEYNRLFSFIKNKKKKYTICECGSGNNEFLKIWEATQIIKNYDLQLIGYNYTQKMDFNFDIFTQFNFLEHQVEPYEMLKEIYEHLNENGYGLITVPSFEFLYENSAYYELIIDHIIYYTKESLENLCKRVGFKVLQTSFVNTNKDTLEIILQKQTIENNSNKIYNLVGNNYKIEDLQNKFYNSYIEVNKNINDFLLKLKDESLCAWGASHQGFTIIATTELKNKIEYVIDSAPFKIGCYVPGSKIKIVDKKYFLEHKTKSILILAPGYIDEIANEIKNNFEEDVKIYYMRGEYVLQR